MMAGIQAFLLLLRGGPLSGRAAVLLGTVFAYSYLVRLHTCMVVLLFTFPLIAAGVVLSRRRWRLLGAFVAPVLLALLVQSSLHRWTVSPEYRRFAEFVELMHTPGFFMPDVPVSAQVLEAHGWSLEDHDLLKFYSFLTIGNPTCRPSGAWRTRRAR